MLWRLRSQRVIIIIIIIIITRQKLIMQFINIINDVLVKQTLSLNLNVNVH